MRRKEYASAQAAGRVSGRERDNQPSLKSCLRQRLSPVRHVGKQNREEETGTQSNRPLDN